MFISFEGPEGAGKSTVLRLVAEELARCGRSVFTTREPGAGYLGSQIRSLLLSGDTMPHETELFLFLADRSNHVRTLIRPHLQRGHWVLCDRYMDSTVVYQAYGRGLDLEFIRRANRLATDGLTPDRTFLLDLAPEIGLSRLSDLDRMDREPLEFHQKVREGFLIEAALATDRWVVCDATKPADEVSEYCLRNLPLH